MRSSRQAPLRGPVFRKPRVYLSGRRRRLAPYGGRSRQPSLGSEVLLDFIPLLRSCASRAGSWCACVIFDARERLKPSVLLSSLLPRRGWPPGRKPPTDIPLNVLRGSASGAMSSVETEDL